jgi:hypothetical protein
MPSGHAAAKQDVLGRSGRAHDPARRPQASLPIGSRRSSTPRHLVTAARGQRADLRLLHAPTKLRRTIRHKSNLKRRAWTRNRDTVRCPARQTTDRAGSSAGREELHQLGAERPRIGRRRRGDGGGRRAGLFQVLYRVNPGSHFFGALGHGARPRPEALLASAQLAAIGPNAGQDREPVPGRSVTDAAS